MATHAKADIPAPSRSPLILALVNSVAVLAAGGMLLYTQVLYKRPPITENSERVRIEALKAAHLPSPTPGFLMFEPVTVNIASSPVSPKPADGTQEQIQGKLHYASLGFALQLRDLNRKDDLDPLRPQILDMVLAILGKKQFQELTTVQGRYLLRSQILQAVNDLAGRHGKNTEGQVQ